MKLYAYCFIIYLLLFVFSQSVFAKVVINEFLIDGSPQQVELLNTSSESATISHWYIDDNGGNSFFTIPDNTILYPNSCFVFSSDFNLNKSSPDEVRLFDNTAPPTSSSAQLIDLFSYKSSSGSGITYFRIPDGQNNWATGSGTLGKYNSTNTSCIITPSPTPTLIITPTIVPSSSPSVSPSPVSTIIPTQSPTYDHILLSEVMVAPEQGQNEWVELYNDNDFNVNLNNWYIDDIENAGSSPKLFTLTISPKRYGVVEMSSAMFNNDGDSVRLLDSNQMIKDSFNYANSKTDETWARGTDFLTFCLQTPSKGSINGECIVATATVTPLSPTPTRIALSSTNNSRSFSKALPITSSFYRYDTSFFPITTPSHKNTVPSVAPDILGAQTENIVPIEENSSLVLSETSRKSSFGIALLNILFIFHKIRNRHYEKDL